MRRSLLALLVVSGLAVAAGAAARTQEQAPPPAQRLVTATTFLVSGRGYGHGVGMSQHGAEGLAREGATYEEILAHYYPGTTLGPAGISVMRVLLAEGRTALTVSSPVPFVVRDAAATTYDLEAGSFRLGRLLELVADGRKQRLTGPLVFRPGKGATLRLDGKPYRGELQVAVVAGRLRAIGFTPLEAYLQGVVPGEMPSTWHPEALKAQAVAARSYALAQRVTGRPYDVYADVRSQVYGGVAVERAATTAAVRATAGRALLYEGKVATTYFHSTSGGRTAAAEQVFARPVPYLVSVPDPTDAISPYHTWGPVLVTPASVGRAARVAAPVVDVRPAPAGGRARTLAIRTTAGERAVDAMSVRLALGLRSTWFRWDVLGLARPAAPVVHGAAVRLTGTARGVKGVSLSVRAGSSWQPVAAVQPDATGAFSVPVRPAAPATYRLAGANGVGPQLRVPVAPRVRFELGGTGTVTPALAGATVLVESLAADGRTWKEIGRTAVEAAGAFRIGVRIGPGSYRARVPATRGWSQGVSPVVTFG